MSLKEEFARGFAIVFYLLFMGVALLIATKPKAL